MAHHPAHEGHHRQVVAAVRLHEDGAQQQLDGDARRQGGDAAY